MMPEGGERAAMSETVAPEMVGQLEAILFASDAPLPVERIAEVLEIDPLEARALVEALRVACDEAARGLAVAEVGGGVRLVTRPEHAPVLMSLQRLRLKSRLSRAAVETLTIVAYRQPISRPEIEQLRGVGTESVLTHLLERRLVRVVGPEGHARPPGALRDDARVPRALRSPGPGGPPALRVTGRRGRGGIRRKRHRRSSSGRDRPVRTPSRWSSPSMRRRARVGSRRPGQTRSGQTRSREERGLSSPA